MCFLCFPSDMKSVSNLLAGELLIDVHHVCSTSADDDTSHLQQYLLHGRGATLLKVLNTISVEVSRDPFSPSTSIPYTI